MNFFNRLNEKQLQVLKLVGLGLAAIVVISFVGRLFGGSISSLSPMDGLRSGYLGSSLPTAAYPPQDSYGKVAAGSAPSPMADLSARNVAEMMPVAPGSGAGNDAENYEAKSYQATIETQDIKQTCASLLTLKTKSYIVFQTANQSTYNCDYSFKVEKAHLEEVLASIKALHPRDLSENTETIKRTIDDFTSEEEILQKKQATIEKTLADAEKAYDEITTVATKAQDASTLANVITSKLQIIERLTQERIDISSQLDRLSRAKADQLDRLDYTYFSVNVFENKYFNGQQLKDSWKSAVKSFVQDINKVGQDLTITLITLIFLAVQYVVYFIIILIIAKYVWQLTKYIWKK